MCAFGRVYNRAKLEREYKLTEQSSAPDARYSLSVEIANVRMDPVEKSQL